MHVIQVQRPKHVLIYNKYHQNSKDILRKQRGIDSTHIKAKQIKAKEEYNIQNEKVDVHANKNRSKEKEKKREIQTIKSNHLKPHMKRRSEKETKKKRDYFSEHTLTHQLRQDE
jgi:hypothetical protein